MPWFTPPWLEDYQWFLVPQGHLGWYWHLYWKDERINGGLNDYEGAADNEAYGQAWRHHTDQDHPMGKYWPVQSS